MRTHLEPHPDTRDTPAKNISVHVARPSADIVVLHYSLTAALDLIAIPAQVSSERTDELWKHTCFEAFIAFDGGYYEFNASPSTQWALYRFSGYREGMAIAHELPRPDITIERGVGRFDLTATLRIPNLPRSARLALTAVIEAVDGAKSYWSLKHPEGKPDFHHADGFALDLPEPQ